jgi:hypothetical protein
MKKLLILLFMSLSLTAQSSSGPDWYDAPLEACFKAAEKGLFIGKGKTEVWMNAPRKKYGNVSSKCGVSYRNFIYDGKEYSLNRVLKRYPTSSTNYCTGLNAAGYAFCEYAEFNNLEDVNPYYYD